MLYYIKRVGWEFMGKKTGVFAVIFIVILTIVLSSSVTYYIVKQNTKEQEKADDKKEDDKKNTPNIAFKDIYDESDKIIEEYDISLNGKINTVKVAFTHSSREDIGCTVHLVLGYIGDTIIYAREYVGSKLGKNEVFNKDIIKKTFNVINFDTIKGQDDKTYLIVYDISNNVAYENKMMVYDDNMKLLTKDLFAKTYDHINRYGFNMQYFYDSPCERTGLPLYVNTTPFYSENGMSFVKKEDDKIYFLAMEIDESKEGRPGKLEERVYTVKDDKLEYKVLNTYDIPEICQQIM